MNQARNLFIKLAKEKRSFDEAMKTKAKEEKELEEKIKEEQKEIKQKVKMGFESLKVSQKKKRINDLLDASIQDLNKLNALDYNNMPLNFVNQSDNLRHEIYRNINYYMDEYPTQSKLSKTRAYNLVKALTDDNRVSDNFKRRLGNKIKRKL